MSQNEENFQNKNTKSGKKPSSFRNKGEGSYSRSRDGENSYKKEGRGRPSGARKTYGEDSGERPSRGRPSSGRSYSRDDSGERPSRGRPSSGRSYARDDSKGFGARRRPSGDDGEKSFARTGERKSFGDKRRSYGDASGERPSRGRPSSGRSYSRDDGEKSFARTGERKSFGDKRRSYGDASGERPARGRPSAGRSYSRDDGEKSFGRTGERKSFGDKRRSYGDASGERPSRGRPSSGRSYSRDDNKGYGRTGERKSFGDKRRSFGDDKKRSYSRGEDRGTRSFNDSEEKVEKRKKLTLNKPEKEDFDLDLNVDSQVFDEQEFFLPEEGDAEESHSTREPKEHFKGKGTSYKKRDKALHNQSSELGNSSPFYLYGFHSVENALLNPNRKNARLFCTETSRKTLEETLNQVVEKGLTLPEIIETEKDEISKLLPKDSVHQGVLLDCEPLDEIFLSDVIINADENAKIIILDKVTDPHNVGAIMRSGAALGAKAVVVQKIHSPDITGVLAKSACGAVEHIPLIKETNLNHSIEKLKEAGFTVIGLDERGERTIAEGKFKGKVAIVLGAEGDGIRQSVGESCDELVKLPTKPPIASLNVSNAAVVALYELIR